MPGRCIAGKRAGGKHRIADDILGEIAPSRLSSTIPGLWREAFPAPRIDGHKYSRGHAVVLSGAGFGDGCGSPRRAGSPASRRGAGDVASPADALPINAAALTAVMVKLADDAREFGHLLDDKRINSVVIGPGSGIGDHTRHCVLAAIAPGRGTRAGCRCADLFCRSSRAAFRAWRHHCRAVLTPHQGEFGQLFKSIAGDSKFSSKLDKARAAAAQSHAVLVLKGPDTTVAAPDGRAAIAENAPPWLATAGSGDVLSGIVAGLLAQGVEAFEAACIGVWMHGEAASEFGPGLIAEDLPEALPAVLRRLIDRIGAQANQAKTR